MLLKQHLSPLLDLGIHVNTKAKLCVHVNKFQCEPKKKDLSEMTIQPIQPKKYLAQYRLKITTNTKWLNLQLPS